MKLKLNLENIFPWLLIFGGIIGLVASLILAHDTLAIAQNPHYIPSCNLNPVVSCGNVITFRGDKIFGLPYPFYGIAAFGALIAAGTGILAKAKFSKWYWLTMQVFTSLGLAGAYYLLIKSMYQIHALCPFCLSVDVVTTIIFWYTTLLNTDRGFFGKIKDASAYKWARKHHLDILVLWFILAIAFILSHFWYYYGKHL